MIPIKYNYYLINTVLNVIDKIAKTRKRLQTEIKIYI